MLLETEVASVATLLVPLADIAKVLEDVGAGVIVKAFTAVAQFLVLPAIVGVHVFTCQHCEQ